VISRIAICPLALQVEQRSRICSARDVERGRRLVGDQELGLAASAIAIITPLFLSAGQLERVGRRCAARVGECRRA
jgi:hypothetical protein